MKVTLGDLLTPACLHLLRKSLSYGREACDSHANNTSALCLPFLVLRRGGRSMQPGMRKCGYIFCAYISLSTQI